MINNYCWKRISIESIFMKLEVNYSTTAQQYL